MRPEKKHALLRAVTILLLLGFLTLGGASAYIVFRHHDSLAASPTDEMYPFNDGWLLETEAGLVPVSLPSSVVPEGNAVTLLKRMEGDVLAPLTLQFSSRIRPLSGSSDGHRYYLRPLMQILLLHDRNS